MLGGGASPGTGFIPIKPDVTGFGSELEAGLDREGTAATQRASQKMQQVMAGAFAAGAAVIGKSVFDFAGFDKGMREVFTLMPDITAPAMDAMTQQVKDFSAEFGVLPTETVPALYEALGAGIPADNVFEFLETAQKLAKGGVTDLATSVDGLSSVVNAYGDEVISAERASDIMFETVKLGKGTVDEVAASLFQVTPVAAAFGVSFEEVGASIATLTAQGVPVSVATTQIRGAIAELGKAGTKASDNFKAIAGMDFQAWIDTGGSMTGALGLMAEAADASGSSLIDMFGSIEGGSAALAITKDLRASNLAVQAMGDSAGATQAAFDVMNTGISATMDRLKAKFSIVLLDIGESIAPTFEAFGMALGGFLEMFSKLPGPMQATILLLATLTAGIFAFAKPIMAGIKLFGMLGKSMTLLAANPWMLAMIGLVAITYLIIKNWDDVRAALESTWGWMKEAGQAVATFFVDLWNSTTAFVRGAFDTLSQFFVDYWPYLLGVFTFGLGTIVGLVIQNWDVIWGKVQQVTGAIVGAVSGAWSTVLGVTTTIGGSVVGFIVGIPTKVASAFTTLAEIIAAPFRAAFNGIKVAWNSTVGGFGFSVPGWIPGVGGNKFNIPSMALGGVALAPMLALVGDAGPRDPEIVSPQSMMRDTVAEAIGQAGGAGGDVIHLHFTVDAGVTDPRFFEAQAVEMTRVIQRELERRRNGGGDDTRGVAA